MWLRLASHWHCTFREAQARCSSHEFALWCQFWRREPWGCEIEDIRMAMICTVMANAFRGKGKAAQLKDFIPNWSGEKRKPQSPEQMRSIMSAFAARFPKEPLAKPPAMKHGTVNRQSGGHPQPKN